MDLSVLRVRQFGALLVGPQTRFTTDPVAQAVLVLVLAVVVDVALLLARQAGRLDLKLVPSRAVLLPSQTSTFGTFHFNGRG